MQSLFSSSRKLAPQGTTKSRGAAQYRLLNNASFEITPGQFRELDEAKKLVRHHTNIFIANIAGLPQSGLIDTIRAVYAGGFNPVPHLSARNIGSIDELKRIAAALKDTRADSVFLIGGGAAQAIGPFADAEQLLAHGEILVKSGITRIGFGAYPEGHPSIDPLLLSESLGRKIEAARALGLKPFFLTQFCFEAAPIVEWERRSRDLYGRRMPLRVGLAGATSVRKLLRYAALCGVQASAAFLTGHAASMLTVLRKWTPEQLIGELSAAIAEDSECTIEGLHLFPFGALENTASLVKDLMEANEHFARELK
jgi:methylenetetrahydrofolate reductase (NADPH)